MSRVYLNDRFVIDKDSFPKAVCGLAQKIQSELYVEIAGEQIFSEQERKLIEKFMSSLDMEEMSIKNNSQYDVYQIVNIFTQAMEKLRYHQRIELAEYSYLWKVVDFTMKYFSPPPLPKISDEKRQLMDEVLQVQSIPPGQDSRPIFKNGGPLFHEGWKELSKSCELTLQKYPV
jgi:hypothetical protein